MKLQELSDGYLEAAALLKVALDDIEAEIETAVGNNRVLLELKARDLRKALQQARDLRRLTMTYYTERQDPAYSCINMIAPKVSSDKMDGK